MQVHKRGRAATGIVRRRRAAAVGVVVLSFVSVGVNAQTVPTTTPLPAVGGVGAGGTGIGRGLISIGAPLPPNLTPTGRARYGYDGWQVFPSISASATLTDNGNFAQKGNEIADLILSTTPSIRLARESSRLKFSGNYSPTFITYTQGSRDDRVLNTLNANGTVELIDRFLFLDGRAQIFQSFVSPFTANRADNTGVSVSQAEIRQFGFGPYAQGRFAGGGNYLIRNDNNYTTVATSGFPDVWTNSVRARASEAPGTFTVLSADYDFFASTFDNVRSITTHLARARATFNIDPPELSVFATAGVERNEFRFGEDNQGGVYGGGFRWAPTPRTDLLASYESRFFGPSYLVDFNHRTRLTQWRLRASRNVTTFQDRAFTTQTSSQFVDDFYVRQGVTDEGLRQTLVNNAVQSGGLPPFVTLPTGFLTTRYFLAETVDGSVVIPGVRNTVTFAMFYRDSKPLVSGTAADTFVDPFSNFGQITQRGASVTWSYSLFPRTTLSSGLDYSRSQGARRTAGTTEERPFKGSTLVYRVGLNHQFSPQTFGSLGFRYQRFGTSPAGFEERAMTVSVTHNF